MIDVPIHIICLGTYCIYLFSLIIIRTQDMIFMKSVIYHAGELVLKWTMSSTCHIESNHRRVEIALEDRIQ